MKLSLVDAQNFVKDIADYERQLNGLLTEAQAFGFQISIVVTENRVRSILKIDPTRISSEET